MLLLGGKTEFKTPYKFALELMHKQKRYLEKRKRKKRFILAETSYSTNLPGVHILDVSRVSSLHLPSVWLLIKSVHTFILLNISFSWKLKIYLFFRHPPRSVFSFGKIKIRQSLSAGCQRLRSICVHLRNAAILCSGV